MVDVKIYEAFQKVIVAASEELGSRQVAGTGTIEERRALAQAIAIIEEIADNEYKGQ